MKSDNNCFSDVLCISVAFGLSIFIMLHWILPLFSSSDEGETKISSKDVEIPIDEPASSIDKFEYNFHSYIKIKDGDNVQIIHDPDCECNK